MILVAFLLAQEAGRFTTVTDECGVGKIVSDAYAAEPKWWLSGIHLIDLDADGDLDLFLSAHGAGRAVAALNDGKGRFTPAEGAIPASEVHLVYDLDEDGKPDLTMTHQDGGGRWWRNKSVPGRLLFEATGIAHGTNTARRQAMIDLDRDGKVDWLRGLGSGILIDAGDGAGGLKPERSLIEVPRTRAEVLCLPVDIDADGDIDLVSEWGHYEAPAGNSRIYRHRGDGTFEEMPFEAGISIKGVGDVDQDGDPDLVVLEKKTFPPVFHLNDGKGGFSRREGLVSGVTGAPTHASWGLAVVVDLDNDGVADLLMNGKHFLKILRGTGGGKFESVNAAWGIADYSASSVDDGLCFGDIDGDGDLDMIGYRRGGSTRLIDVYRNDLLAKHWVRVRPVGAKGNRGAAGAKIRVFEAKDKLLWSEQVAIYDSQVSTNYYGAAETERHFGLGDRKEVDVSVEFYPSGKVVRREKVASGSVVRVSEE
jgi:hypothetical protein